MNRIETAENTTQLITANLSESREKIEFILNPTSFVHIQRVVLDATASGVRNFSAGSSTLMHVIAPEGSAATPGG